MAQAELTIPEDRNLTWLRAFDDLPFMRSGRYSITSSWHVPRSGKDDIDYALGRGFGLAFEEALQQAPHRGEQAFVGAWRVEHVLMDMVKGGHAGAVERGFIERLSRLIVRGLSSAIPEQV